MDLTYWRSILIVVTFALGYRLFSFLNEGRKQRAFYSNVPCPPHSGLWGHLKLMGETIKELPPDLHFQCLMAYIGKKYNLPAVFYLDLWPASYPMMIIHDPGVANQITLTKSMPKHEVNRRYISPLVGYQSVVTLEGPDWKRVRSILNPGFSPAYLATLMPILTKHVGRFTQKLSTAADTNEVVHLQDYLLSLTFDVICEVVLGVDSDSQRQYNALAYHYGKAAKATSVTSTTMNLPRKYYLRALQWHHARQQCLIIADIVKQRWSSQAKIDKRKPKAAIDLFLEAYRSSESDKFINSAPWEDNGFMEILVDNTRSLLLGGHDTTSSALAWTIALLALNPETLSRVRDEHNSLLPSVPAIPETIIAQPSLLNQLPYTTAVIKEATRIFTPASTTRYSNPLDPSHPTHVTLAGHPDPLPLSGQQAWVNHFGIGRNTAIWPNPTAFIPERHLPNPPSDSVPSTGYVKDAWRIFERGPRACSGMELAMNEMKLVLLETMRRFEFEVAYEEDHPRAPDLFGGQMYQVMEFAAKPVKHMPVRVRRWKGSE
jgi:cytochrome P450